jgi:hypothetical protein
MTNQPRARIVRSFLLLLTLAAATTSCGSSSGNPVVPPPAPPPPPPVVVASVEMSATTATLEIGGTTTLTATPRDATGTALTGHSVMWSSDPSIIATVSNGLVTAVSAGLATITATSEGKSATAQITVNAAPPLSCESTTPTGRLTLLPEGGVYRYTTSGGWRVDVIDTWNVTIAHPSIPLFSVQFWGGSLDPIPLPLAHESLGGKHMKDMVTDRRSIQLPDATLITIYSTASPLSGLVSIHDSDQTHQLEVVAFKVTQSCMIGNFGEADEADGEASRLWLEAGHLWWENTYNQSADPAGTPGPKVPNPALIGEAIPPNQINDYFDDPRFGHT